MTSHLIPSTSGWTTRVLTTWSPLPVLLFLIKNDGIPSKLGALGAAVAFIHSAA